MYLIDTDILIYALKARPNVLVRFAETREAPKAISVVSYGELLFGAMKSSRPQESLARARRVGELFQVVDVTRAIIEGFAAIKADLQRKGAPLDDFDLIIAATAVSLGYRLVTNNERHFRRVPGLRVENWAG
ncbi:MAG: type II toxin-antitoxin system VapC family toxin [Candidatus Sumerlaeota bacterium]|nr:type II toxin-antitoxin system VapC family toxin [Candidatus Sumerlaeota bacterium]